MLQFAILSFEENNIQQGFFEHADFVALRSVLPSFMAAFVTIGYKTVTVANFSTNKEAAKSG